MNEQQPIDEPKPPQPNVNDTGGGGDIRANFDERSTEANVVDANDSESDAGSSSSSSASIEYLAKTRSRRPNAGNRMAAAMKEVKSAEFDADDAPPGGNLVSLIGGRSSSAASDAHNVSGMAEEEEDDDYEPDDDDDDGIEKINDDEKNSSSSGNESDGDNNDEAKEEANADDVVEEEAGAEPVDWQRDLYLKAPLKDADVITERAYRIATKCVKLLRGGDLLFKQLVCSICLAPQSTSDNEVVVCDGCGVQASADQIAIAFLCFNKKCVLCTGARALLRNSRSDGSSSAVRRLVQIGSR